MILINWSNTINFDTSFIHNLCVPDILSSRYVIFLEDNKSVKESLFVYFSTRTHLQNSLEMESKPNLFASICVTTINTLIPTISYLSKASLISEPT